VYVRVALPDTPSNVSVLEEAATWVQLSAEPPRRDGGVPISHWSVKYELADGVRGHSSSRLFTNGELSTSHSFIHSSTDQGRNSSPRRPRNAGVEGSRGPFAAGKRNCSTRPYQRRLFNPYPSVHVMDGGWILVS